MKQPVINEHSKIKPCAIASLILSFTIMFNASANQQFELSLSNSETDFIGDDQHAIKPTGVGFNYGFDLDNDWSLDFDYQQSKGKETWFSHRTLFREFYESGEFDSESYGFNVVWIPDEHGVSFGFNQINTNESSITYLPFLSETVEGKNNVFNLSYLGQWSGLSTDIEDVFDENENNWGLDWRIGFQYFDLDYDILDIPNGEIPTQIDIQLQQQSLSAFADVSVNYLILGEQLSWSPYFTLSWNWEINVSGEASALLSRGERTLIIEQSGSRFNDQIRTPNTGTMDLGIKFFWENEESLAGESSVNWGVNFAFSQSLASEIDYSETKITLSVDF